MFKAKNGEEIFVIDAHIHLWDGSPDNQLNIHGSQFINCFYDYHKNLSPKNYVWSKEEFMKYDTDTMITDVFVNGYADMAIFQPVFLTDFYKEPFGNVEKNAEAIKQYPGRLIGNGSFDPRDGEKGLEYLDYLAETHGAQGVKLYTAEWHGNSRGYKLTDAWTQRYLEKCEKLGITNIHVHKGPTLTPLDRDAFDVADVDGAASDFPNLNFIVEHCGLPRLEDFCWIAVQESNVYAGLSVVMPFIHARPGYFAKVISELLYWVGEDKILYSSDYALWHPKWIVEKFMDFELSPEIKLETGVDLTLDVKKKILGENAARLYGIDIEKQKLILKGDQLSKRIAQSA